MYGFRLLSCLYRLRKNQNRLTFKNDTPKLLSLPIFDHRTFEFTLPGGKISSVNLDVAMGTITLVLIPALSPTIRFHLILISCLGFQIRYQNSTLWPSTFWQNPARSLQKKGLKTTNQDRVCCGNQQKCFIMFKNWIKVCH